MPVGGGGKGAPTTAVVGKNALAFAAGGSASAAIRAAQIGTAPLTKAEKRAAKELQAKESAGGGVRSQKQQQAINDAKSIAGNVKAKATKAQVKAEKTAAFNAKQWTRADGGGFSSSGGAAPAPTAHPVPPPPAPSYEDDSSLAKAALAKAASAADARATEADAARALWTASETVVNLSQSKLMAEEDKLAAGRAALNTLRASASAANVHAHAHDGMDSWAVSLLTIARRYVAVETARALWSHARKDVLAASKRSTGAGLAAALARARVAVCKAELETARRREALQREKRDAKGGPSVTSTTLQALEIAEKTATMELADARAARDDLSGSILTIGTLEMAAAEAVEAAEREGGRAKALYLVFESVKAIIAPASESLDEAIEHVRRLTLIAGMADFDMAIAP